MTKAKRAPTHRLFFHVLTGVPPHVPQPGSISATATTAWAELEFNDRSMSADFVSTDRLAFDDAMEILRLLRGALAFRLGQPIEVANVVVQSLQDGHTIGGVPARVHRGFADAVQTEIDAGLALASRLRPLEPYALALDYFNAGRMFHMRPMGVPEASVIFFFKVLEALLSTVKDQRKRHHAWLAAGMKTNELARLDRLIEYRNEWDVAHARRRAVKLWMRNADEAMETARMILDRLAP
jgi:hypothetical protein